MHFVHRGASRAPKAATAAAALFVLVAPTRPASADSIITGNHWSGVYQHGAPAALVITDGSVNLPGTATRSNVGETGATYDDGFGNSNVFVNHVLVANTVPGGAPLGGSFSGTHFSGDVGVSARARTTVALDYFVRSYMEQGTDFTLTTAGNWSLSGDVISRVSTSTGTGGVATAATHISLVNTATSAVVLDDTYTVNSTATDFRSLAFSGALGPGSYSLLISFEGRVDYAIGAAGPFAGGDSAAVSFRNVDFTIASAPAPLPTPAALTGGVALCSLLFARRFRITIS